MATLCTFVAEARSGLAVSALSSVPPPPSLEERALNDIGSRGCSHACGRKPTHADAKFPAVTRWSDEADYLLALTVPTKPGQGE